MFVYIAWAAVHVSLGVKYTRLTGVNAVTNLTQRRILLGVTGGIAAYKSADLVRRLREAGAEVQVVMTEGGKRFITPLTMQAVSGRPVRDSLLDTAAEAAMGHIELARWADLILVAPASADFIARLAQGRADDLLCTLCLATDAPIAVAPAMNRLMWANAATQANVNTLRDRGISLWGPGEGDQACGEVGPGRMLEPLELVERVGGYFSNGPLSGLKVLLTAGPTREPLDPVRFITNRSSGRMGYALAEACEAAGAQVTLVSGPVQLPTPAGVARIDVETAAEMHAAVMAHAGEADIFIGCAAVADYRPDNCADSKIKKGSEQAGEAMQIGMTRNADILADVAARFDGLFTVGFAAETDNLQDYARSKLQRKGLDMIAANWVGADRGFDRDDNALWVFWVGGEQALPNAPKKVLARQLVDLIDLRLKQRPQNDEQHSAADAGKDSG